MSSRGPHPGQPRKAQAASAARALRAQVRQRAAVAKARRVAGRLERERDKQKLRLTLQSARADAVAKLAAQPQLAQRQAKRRRQRALLLLLLALALLLLFSRCGCEEPLPPPSSERPPAPVVSTPAARVPKAPPLARLQKNPRPAFVPERVAPPSWLAELHLQVAARSPRLSSCFNGTKAPGALRWTASVAVTSGEVSDQALELVGASLTSAQQQCLLQALSAPPYRLTPPEDDDALSRRVSILVEF